MLDEEENKYWTKPEKSTVFIDFESMFRFTIGAFVDPFASFRDEMQFLDESGMETKYLIPM